MNYIDRASEYLTQEDLEGSIYGGGNRKQEVANPASYAKLETPDLIEAAKQAKGRGDMGLYRELVTMVSQRPDAPQGKW